MKTIGILMLVIGGILFLSSGYNYITALLTSREEIIEDLRNNDSQEGNENSLSDSVLEGIAEHTITIARIISPIMMIVTGGIAFGGFLLYKQSKRKSSLISFEIKKLIDKQNKALTSTLLVFIILFIATGYIGVRLESLWLLIFLFACFLGIIYYVREIIFFNYNFGDPGKHLVNWEYPNGDKLIVTCWGLMKKSTENTELSVSAKFEGFKWNFDNAKDLAESLIKHEGNPLLTLLPSIEFSTTSNRVDDYVPFSFIDKVKLTFIEKDNGYLIISIEKKNLDSIYTLRYPLPPSKQLLETEVNIFEERITKRKTPVRGVYLDKFYVEKVSNS